MRAVNLLPKDLERAGSEKTRAPLLVLGAGLALVTAATIAVAFSTASTISDRRADLTAAESALRLSTAREPAAPARGIVVQERTDRVAALAAALSSRVPLDGLLRQLAYVLPADAWLTGLSLTTADSSGPTGSGTPPPSGTPAPAAGQAAAATTVTIDGVTYSQESVARVLARLAIVPSLEDVRLTKSELVQPQAAPEQPGPGAAAKPKAKKEKKRPSVVTFSITASYAKGLS